MYIAQALNILVSAFILPDDASSTKQVFSRHRDDSLSDPIGRWLCHRKLPRSISSPNGDDNSKYTYINACKTLDSAFNLENSETPVMPSAASSPVPSKSINMPSQQLSSRYRDAVSQGVRARVDQLIQRGVLRPVRPNKQCSGSWKPRMDLVDDPSLPNVIAIFELPGVKNENITLQIKEKRLMVLGKRLDPFTEALAAARSSSEQSSLATNSPGIATNLASNAPTTPGSSATSVSITPSATEKSIRELRYGSFFRSLPVPEGIKQTEVNAGIQDGMLTVSWPRVPAATRSTTSEVAPVTHVTGPPMNGIDSAPTAQASVSTEAAPMLQ